jgi:hypothetical protein
MLLLPPSSTHDFVGLSLTDLTVTDGVCLLAHHNVTTTLDINERQMGVTMVAAAAVSLVVQHGSLLYPLPRGGIDRDLAPFNTGGWPAGHYPCTCTNGTAEGPCLPAQSCLWFNQGCTIGCPCSGNGTMSRRPNWSSCDTPANATNNSPKTRSLNRGAVPGSPEDVCALRLLRAPALPRPPPHLPAHRPCPIPAPLEVPPRGH